MSDSLVRPLPVTRGTPQPGESFLGFFTRTAAVNPIRHTLTNLRQAQDVTNIYPRNLALRADDLERFAQLLGVDVAALLPTTLPPRAGNTARLLGGAHIFPSDLDWHRRRLAPQRLHQQPYHRTLWQLRFVTVDPVTFEPLIESCPVCRQGLRWSRSVEPYLCDHCVDDRGRSNIDLREFPATPIQLSDPHAYSFVFALVDPANGTAIESSEWPGIKPAVLFELAILLARWCNASNVASSIGRWKDIQPEMLARAGRIILNGPAALRTFDEATATTLQRRFRNSVVANRWLDLPVRQLVEQTIEPWNEIAPSMPQAGANLSSTRTILRSPPPSAPIPLTDEFLAGFARTCANATADRDVARSLGVSQSDVGLLISEGLLTRPSKLAIATLKRSNLVTGESLSALLKSLSDLEQEADERHQVFACSRIIETAQFPYSAGALITALTKARLPIFRVEQPTRANWTSMFGVVDIDPLPRLCQKLQLRPSRQGWLKTVVDAANENQLTLDL